MNRFCLICILITLEMSIYLPAQAQNCLTVFNSTFSQAVLTKPENIDRRNKEAFPNTLPPPSSIRNLNLLGFLKPSSTGIRVRVSDLESHTFQDFNTSPPQNFIETIHFLSQFLSGLTNVYNSYGPKLKAKDKPEIMMTDFSTLLRDFNSGSVSFASVTGLNPTLQKIENYGFLRVLETSINNVSSAEKILVQKKINFTYLNELRKQGTLIIEIGKFMLSPQLNPTDRILVKKELLRWLYDSFLKNGALETENVLFVMDVFHEAHKVLYRREYGALPLEDNLFSPTLPPSDHLLTVSKKELKKHLEKILDLGLRNQ